MTKEDKKLLINDICNRLPYKVKVGFDSDCGMIGEVMDYEVSTKTLYVRQITPNNDCTTSCFFPIHYFRPYLRRMSSMTAKEKKVLYEKHTEAIESEYTIAGFIVLDYLNSIHVDYRNLIQKGLALEAPEGMYN